MILASKQSRCFPIFNCSFISNSMMLKSIQHFALQQIRQISSASAAVTRLHRSIYARQYPTVVVLPDGSTINIRYGEPRKIIKLPLDLSTLSDAERKARLEARKPRKKVKIAEEVDDKFNARKYIKYIKRK